MHACIWCIHPPSFVLSLSLALSLANLLHPLLAKTHVLISCAPLDEVLYVQAVVQLQEGAPVSVIVAIVVRLIVGNC